MIVEINLHDPWNRRRIHNTHNGRANRQVADYRTTWLHLKSYWKEYSWHNAGQKLISTRERLTISQVASDWAGDCSAWPGLKKRAWRTSES
jgi:hypothetical protein